MSGTSYVEGIYKSISGLLFASPLTACAGAPNETCLTTGSLPQVGTNVREFEGEYDISDPNRPEVTWKIFDIANCDGSTNGIEVIASFGPEGLAKAELVEADNGTLTAIIKHRFDQELSGPFKVTIKSSEYGTEKEIEIWPPRYKSPEPTILGPCDYNPSPVIHGNIEMNPNPSDVYAGQPVTFSFPASLLAECDGTTGDKSTNLKVSFTIENKEVPATLEEEKYYTSPHVFHYPGEQKVFMKVEDISRPNAAPQYISIEFWVKEALP